MTERKAEMICTSFNTGRKEVINEDNTNLENIEVVSEQLGGNIQGGRPRQEGVLGVDHRLLQSAADAERVHVVRELVEVGVLPGDKNMPLIWLVWL